MDVVFISIVCLFYGDLINKALLVAIGHAGIVFVITSTIRGIFRIFHFYPVFLCPKIPRVDVEILKHFVLQYGLMKMCFGSACLI